MTHSHNKKSNAILRKKLNRIRHEEKKTLRAAVAKEALDYEEPAAFFDDLLSHGCVSGMVSSLVYYTQTHKFYDKHYQEIEELRLEFEASTGTSLAMDSDLKNTLAWFAFEETAYQLANELGLEI